MNSYTLKVAGLARELPVIPITDKLCIASFVILGDAELVEKAAEALAGKLPPVDAIVTAEAKGIPLAYELSRRLGLGRYVVARKSVKPYMAAPLLHKVVSITTQKEQVLALDRADAEFLRGKRAAIVDDVISTGESLRALEELVGLAGGIVEAKAAILAEGDAAGRDDIVFLEKLPLFPR